jgi:hypothetical protein
MSKLKRYTQNEGEFHGELGFMCLGCGHRHFISDNETDGHKLSWTFNKNYESPTISPSILFYHPDGSYRCHSFITDGKIQYLSDCTHELKGQTIELPEI